MLKITRRAFAIGSVAVLSACARQGPVVFNRQAAATIKRIGLPPVGFPRSPDVRVLHGISDAMAPFGLIGAIGSMSGMVVRGNRSDSVVRMMAARSFDPSAVMTALVAAALTAKGFTVVPLSGDPKRSFMESVANAPEYDAVLDCYAQLYGFFASTDSENSPFRTSIDLRARLVGRDNAVLMQDNVIAAAGHPDIPRGRSSKPAFTPVPLDPAAPLPPPKPTPEEELTPLAPGTFRSFSDAEKDPAAAIEALRQVFTTAADGVVQRLT